MRLACVATGDRILVGEVVGDQFTPLDAGAMRPGLTAEREGVVCAGRSPIVGPDAAIPLAACRLLPPVPRPGKIVCAGANYRAHAAEAGVAPPPYPEIFAKFGNTVIATGDPIPSSGPDPRIDWEGELVAVIGERVRGISEADALSVVAGYTIANDVSARGWQTRVTQWVTGKSFDGFCPVGPWMTTSDELPDPQALELTTRLNGQVVQQASTADMLFPVRALVAYLSSVMTLEPGDLILTGTPEGVGAHRTPPRFLGPGDVIEVEVQGIGALTNPVGS